MTVPIVIQPLQPVQPAPAQSAPAQLPGLDLTPEEMISPSQHIAGVSKSYYIFRRADQQYTFYNNLVNDRPVPILTGPLGTTTPSGEQEKLQIDLLAPFKKMQEPAEKKAALEAAFGRQNNFWGHRYTTALDNFALASLNAWRIVSGEVELEAEIGDYTELVQELNDTYKEYEPKWLACKELEDDLAAGRVSAKIAGDIGIDLGDFLTVAQIPVEQQPQILSQWLGTRINELWRDLEPWLSSMAQTAAAATECIAKSRPQPN